MCYVHRELLNGVYYTNWNCLREAMNSEQNIDLICKGAHNTDTEEYFCCSDSNNCNENVQIVLPIERPQPVSTGAATTAPLTTVEEAGSGSGSTNLLLTTEPTDAEPETISRSTSASTSTSRPPFSTTTTLRTPTQAATTLSSTTQPQGRKKFCIAWLSHFLTLVSILIYTHKKCQ